MSQITLAYAVAIYGDSFAESTRQEACFRRIVKFVHSDIRSEDFFARSYVASLYMYPVCHVHSWYRYCLSVELRQQCNQSPLETLTTD